MPRLTKPLLEAIRSALDAALAGGGESFNGGDFEGENIEHYERALNWATDELIRRERAASKRAGGH